MNWFQLLCAPFAFPRHTALIASRSFMPTESDTCRKFIVPKLQRAGWENDPHAIGEQRPITDGRIVPRGKGHVRRPPKKPDCRGRRVV